MIRLTRINHIPLVLNSDLIEHLEVTPDTVIAMTSGQKFMVMESADEVIQKVIEFRRSIINRPEALIQREEETPAEDEQP
ncbi:MAG: flagellar FlbD family protein [Acidobacteriia bacterium]|nr:flagellar FlbD family protein [Terriglobia bacterium]